MNLDYINTIFLFFTAVATFIIYHMNKVDDVKSTAKILCNQIEEIEKNIAFLKKHGVVLDSLNESDMFNSPMIFYENKWSLYSHKIFSYITYEHYVLITNFYKNATAILKLQNDVKQFSLYSLQARATGYYNGIYQMINMNSADEQIQTQINNYRIRFDQIQVPSYIPKHYSIYLNLYLNEYKPLLGTTAYLELKKVSQKKRFFII